MQLSELDIYCFCDPAAKPRPGITLKRVRARTAIIAIGTCSLQRIFVLEAWAEKCHPTRRAEKIFEVNECLHPRVFGYEANAMQEDACDLLGLEASRRGIALPLREVWQPTKVDKEWRIRQIVQPVVAEGRLFVQEHHVELLSELTTFPSGRTRDLVDALASAISLVPRRTIAQQTDSERVALAAWLRQRGVPADYLRQRLTRYDREHGCSTTGGPSSWSSNLQN
jgi:hypothetical protein